MKLKSVSAYFKRCLMPESYNRKCNVKRNYNFFNASIWFLIALCQFLLLIYVNIRNKDYPKPRSAALENFYFSEEKAREYLHGLTSLGSRIVGSSTNQNDAVRYIWTEIEKIHDDIQMKSHYMMIDLQTAKGSFDLEFLGGFTNIYENINNIVACLVPYDKKINKTLLINCHYDTFLGTQGASDDSVSCAIMLAVMHAITKRTRFVRNMNIMFLFNGAEETLLQGSHAFVTSHPWFKKVDYFINLEAAGAGGKELLFQTASSSPLLLRAYENVPHPFASSMAQEIFQSGIVQSDTDFRIFRDFGGVPGMDIAYIRNGYFYHTRHDTPDKIPPGCIQRTGENLINLVRSIYEQITSVDLVDRNQEQLVFFDLLGFSLVVYSLDVLNLFNAGICLLLHFKISLQLFIAKTKRARLLHSRRLLLGMLSIFASWAFSLVVVAIIAVFLNLIGCPMTWFNNTWLLFGLYAVPSMATTYFVMIKLKNYWSEEGISELQMEKLVSTSIMIIISIVLMWLSWMRVASSFMLFALLCSIMCRELFLWVISLWKMTWLMMKTNQLLITKDNEPTSGNLPTFLLAIHICPLIHNQLFSIYYMDGLLSTFIPLMGRAGPSLNSDLVIGILVSLVTNYHILCHISMIFLLEIPKARKVFGYTFLVFLFLATCTSLGFPYSDDPKYPVNQRIFIQHVQRKFNPPLGSSEQAYEDSLLTFVPLDRTGLTYLRSIRELDFSKFKLLACSDQPYCGWAYYLPLISQMDQLYHIPAPRLEIRPEVSVKFNQVLESATGKLVNFTFTGPEYMSIYISPCAGSRLISWNIGSGSPLPTKMPHGVKSPQYFVFVAFGVIPLEPLWLNLTLVQHEFYDNRENCLVQVAVVGHYLPMVDRPIVSPVLEHYLDHLPSWTSVLHIASTYESWTI